MTDFYPVLTPSGALGAYTENLDSRFREREDGFREKLLEAMRWEDSVLRKYIEKSQLEKWFTHVESVAQRPSQANGSNGHNGAMIHVNGDAE